MSKTYKDRPYWVRVNDPKSSRYEHHDHLVTIPEKIGEEVTYKTKFNWRNGDPQTTDEVDRIRGLYHYHSVVVPCSIDKPEQSPNSSWRRGYPYKVTPEERLAEKRCHYHLNYDGDYVSGSSWKRLTNSAVRSNVRQQLHNAVRDYGRWNDYYVYVDAYYPDEFTIHDKWEADGIDWDSVDIWLDNKYARRSWWD